MALHRDIYWLGRQWAVTGFGLQAIDQRLKGAFDIEGARLWQDGALDGLRAQSWLNAADLDKALAAARKRYPEPPRQKAGSTVEATLRLSESILSQPARTLAAGSEAARRRAACEICAAMAHPAIKRRPRICTSTWRENATLFRLDLRFA